MTSNSKQKSLYQISFYWVALALCFLPLFATVFCVMWSILYNFEASTRTHCRVRNYLPSVSAAIGAFSPQRYIWRICIALHSTPRLLQAIAYYNFYLSVHVGKDQGLYTALASVNSIAHIVEVMGLVGLTFVSSVENHEIHVVCFVLFISGSVVYMLLTILLFSWGPGNTRHELQDFKSLRWKRQCCAINFAALALSVYMYYRHNTYCEPGVYTLFCLCEYVAIFTNIGFHFSTTWDFNMSKLSLVRDVQWSLPV